MKKIIILITVFTILCGASNNKRKMEPIPERYKDVLILSTLIQNHFRVKIENQRTVDLNELIQQDQANRISTNFEKLDLKSKGGYISVYFKFSNSRANDQIELNEKEKELMNKCKWKEKKSDKDFDGEIRFAYGERFYNIKEIMVYN